MILKRLTVCLMSLGSLAVDQVVSLQPISASQVRAARSMIRMSLVNLAKAASLSPVTVLDAEGGSGRSVTMAAMAAIQQALEAAGVEFTAGNGVRLAETKPSLTMANVAFSTQGR